MAKEQIVTKYKEEARVALKRYKDLLAMNEHSDEELYELSLITRKFGNLNQFIRVQKANYDSRANNGWGGYGAPNCYCHVNPPCSNCIMWTNYCSEREFLHGSKEPGCAIIGHDCEVARTPV